MIKGEPYGKSDVIGCYLNLDMSHIRWTKNGKDLGLAFEIPPNIRNQPFYPTVCMKNAEILFNFGPDFKFPPTLGHHSIQLSQDHANSTNVVISPKLASTLAQNKMKRDHRAPLALIIEPSKELAEQTYKQIELFSNRLSTPSIKQLLIVGGVPLKEQLERLEKNGCDICVATPGRLDDMVSSGRLSLTQVKFFVLDEVDGLLSQGHRELILKCFNRIPKVNWTFF